MNIFAISDLHLDYASNRQWLFSLKPETYHLDILIVAGDISDNKTILAECLKHLAQCFYRVIFVPGNHDLWVMRDKNINSLEKFYEVMALAEHHGVITAPLSLPGVSITPLLSWYDYSFGQPSDKLQQAWMDFRACRWPEGFAPADVSDYFLNKNSQVMPRNTLTITVSHFLPSLDVLPHFIPERFHYLWPVLGANALGEQVKSLKPHMHIYGHSHVNRDVVIDGIRYINNAFGYPNETSISKKQLLCIAQLQDQPAA